MSHWDLGNCDGLFTLLLFIRLFCRLNNKSVDHKKINKLFDNESNCVVRASPHRVNVNKDNSLS